MRNMRSAIRATRATDTSLSPSLVLSFAMVPPYSRFHPTRPTDDFRRLTGGSASRMPEAMIAIRRAELSHAFHDDYDPRGLSQACPARLHAGSPRDRENGEVQSGT